ncbi:formimidoylglutamase [Pseudarthrobacter psychrotolerans]|uniref:Formimidoylglutamase n=1 Tax=Pseudarthrobacter psychrotolerans TaxID=2697569 RepID=A0A6P1NMK1_9MICC|nr:formimidoylglutamase [Pseudarthrobacter psychrotolerans]QHK20508.1 formimidoylglutamase [Pseudarthrobacter psychrotolerans]
MTNPTTQHTWTGRDDGPGPEHRRWHHAVNTAQAGTPGVALLGFRSDEGVRRNKGRVGAVDGPASIRSALAPMAAPADLLVHDLGDTSVVDGNLEDGQERLGAAVRQALDAGHLPVILGGGHETAFGTYTGLRGSQATDGRRIGIINLDAHFDLRAEAIPSSGTPFRQVAEAESALGHGFNYTVVGISQPGNTEALFRTAQELGVKYLLDEECTESRAEQVRQFVQDFIDSVDVLYLTIDLDVLPAYVAPGVSAPASYGVPLPVVLDVCRQLARSPKLAVVDVVELNPRFDIDARTARTAARLIHTIATERSGHRHA